MAIPYSRLTTAQLSALASTTLGNLYPYQIRQVQEVLDRVNWGPDGSDSDVSAQPTISSIITSLGANNP